MSSHEAPLGPKHRLVQQARLLARERREREAAGLAHMEGVRLVEEALAAGVEVAYLLYSPDLAERPRGAELLRAASARGVPLYRATPEALERAADTQTPQGVVGVFRPRPWALDDLGPGLVLVLDNLQDPGNLGTVVRTLEALGGGGAVVAGGVDPYNPKVVRGAMGSLFRLPVVKLGLDAALRGLRARGRRIYVADAGGALSPWEATLTRAAVVIGNEGAGPSPLARQEADGVVSIPMVGPTESLNAGVAAALMVYEALRQQA
ncbi:TrmH family RNA methyltransferase [Symbiobacterium terraclitae]|uniref:TrmH family RNA methyltransferase n=1 Tax=Symbiobacterium terraclitae TaxID=557451 RepID=UPI0035B529CD